MFNPSLDNNNNSNFDPATPLIPPPDKRFHKFALLVLGVHALVYFSYFVADLIALFTAGNNTSFAFYATVLWTGFNYINFFITIAVVVSVYSWRIPSTKDQRDINGVKFGRDLGLVILYLMFIDALGLAVDIASLQDVSAENKALRTKINLEIFADFVLSIVLDPFLFGYYIWKVDESNAFYTIPKGDMKTSSG